MKPLAALFALTALAALPAAAPVAATAQATAQPAPAAGIQISNDADDDIPTSAPKDDYRFVAWCYGALDEYLRVYEQVKPDLKDIDKQFGTPVVEAEPYSADIAEDRKALKRFSLAIQAAQKISTRPIADDGAAAAGAGRAIWTQVEGEPHRRLADAWLFWGVPDRCDRVAKRLKLRAAQHDQTLALYSPAPDAPAPAQDAAKP